MCNQEILQNFNNHRLKEGENQEDEETFPLMMTIDSPAALSSSDESPRVKFLVSFGGSILPRPQDFKLRYVGGETRIVSLPRDINFDELMSKMRELFEAAEVLKYQQPDEDLDALLSVVNDDDVVNMMEKYDKLGDGGGFTQLRMFLFPNIWSSSPHFDSAERDIERRYVDALYSLNDASELFRVGQSPESPVMGAVAPEALINPVNVDYIKKVDKELLLNARDKNGDTALMIATEEGDLDLCKEILKKCPSLLYDENNWYKLGLSEIVGAENKTALQWAIHCKNHEMIKALIGSGAMLLNTTVASKSNIFTLVEVSKHNNLNDCWLLIDDKVYDVTNFFGDHPGGNEVLLKASGKDATSDFKKVHNQSRNVVTLMDKFYIGVCDSVTSTLSKLASDKPQQYSRVQLKELTKDFSQLIGSGGFGDVYKGQFPNGVFIAVKVLKNIEFEKVMKEQFVAEVDTMGRAYHRNLIKLYGYCYEAKTKFKALVYDYMENGSFDRILFEKKLDIPWEKLCNIAKEIAQGISYLHESCSPQIIHQDIKPSNVLLDSNLAPKIIDFGLAKVTEESQFEQTKIKGSRNYMAPEVNQSEPVKLSCKVDVYSYGKMLFDILGSKRNHVEKSRFPGQVWEKYKTNQLENFILDCGIYKKDIENAKRLAIIALLCVEHNPRARPMLSTVVKMLEGKIKLGTPLAPFYPGYYTSESSSTSDSRDY